MKINQNLSVSHLKPKIKRLFELSGQKILDIEKKAVENPQLKKLFTNSMMVKTEAMHFYNVPPEKIEVIQINF